MDEGTPDARTTYMITRNDGRDTRTLGNGREEAITEDRLTEGKDNDNNGDVRNYGVWQCEPFIRLGYFRFFYPVAV